MRVDLQQTIAELQRLLQAASPGPWQAVQCHGMDCIWHDVVDANDNEVLNGDITPTWTRGDQEDQQAQADMEFIAAARNHLGALLAYLDALETSGTHLSEENYAEDFHSKQDTIVPGGLAGVTDRTAGKTLTGEQKENLERSLGTFACYCLLLGIILSAVLLTWRW